MKNKLKPIYEILDKYKDFSEIFYSLIDPSDLKLKTLNLGTALWLKERQLDLLFQYTGQTIELQKNQSQEAIEYIRHLDVSSDYLIYPGSAAGFYKTYFSSRFTPFVGDVMYDCMRAFNLVKTVGAGQGYAVLVKPPTTELTQEFYQSFVSDYVPNILSDAVSELTSSKKRVKLNSANNYYNMIHQELLYYQNLTQNLSTLVEQKDALINKIQNDIFVNAQLTWR